MRHRREFFTRFFPEWSTLTTLDETLARDESVDWREEKLRHGLSASPSMPTASSRCSKSRIATVP